MEGTFAGRLTTVHGLRCEDCKVNPALKRARGCGVPPINPHTGEAWDPHAYAANSLEQGRKRADVAKQAPNEYRLANVGEVYERRGWLWPCCPKSLQRDDIVRRSAMRQAQHVLLMVDAVRRGDASRVRVRPLTAHGLRLVNEVERMWEELAADVRREDKGDDGAGQGGQPMPPRRTAMQRGPRRR